VGGAEGGAEQKIEVVVSPSCVQKQESGEQVEGRVYIDEI
jgi:hypothetical protein